MVIDFVGLGSACLAVPVLKALEDRHPQVRYSYPINALLTDPRIGKASGLRSLIMLTPSRWRRFDYADWPDLAAFLERHQIDTVVNFRNPDLAVDPRYAQFRAWHTERRGGVHWSDLYGEPDLGAIHVQARMRKALQGAGFTLGPLRQDWLRSLAGEPDGHRIGLFCSASVPAKRWPLEYWMRLVRLLAVREDVGFDVLGGTGGPEQDAARDLLEGLMDLVTASRVRLVPTGTTGELVSRLGRLSLVVAGDTGVGHVAAACGTPTVSLFLSTNPDVWRPAPAKAASLRGLIGARCPNQRPSQGNCTHHYDTCDAPCHWDLTPEVVAATVRGLRTSGPAVAVPTRRENHDD